MKSEIRRPSATSLNFQYHPGMWTSKSLIFFHLREKERERDLS